MRFFFLSFFHLIYLFALSAEAVRCESATRGRARCGRGRRRTPSPSGSLRALGGAAAGNRSRVSLEIERGRVAESGNRSRVSLEIERGRVGRRRRRAPAAAQLGPGEPQEGNSTSLV